MVILEEDIVSEAEVTRIYKRISRNIKYYRINNNSIYADEFGRITIERLAEVCDLSRTFIANICSENVDQNFSIKTVFKISKALNVNFEDLFIEHKWSIVEDYDQ